MYDAWRLSAVTKKASEKALICFDIADIPPEDTILACEIIKRPSEETNLASENANSASKNANNAFKITKRVFKITNFGFKIA